MRKIIAVWAIALLFTGSLFGGELIWEKDTATAFAKAKAEKKNVMLMVEAIHCRWCKKMKLYLTKRYKNVFKAIYW